MKVINVAVLIQHLDAFPGYLAQALAGKPTEQLTVPMGDEWSVAMVVTHLMHCETHYRARFDRIMREAAPFLPTFGPELASPLTQASLEVVIQRFRRERQHTMAQIYAYDEVDWLRPARHEVSGATTLGEEFRRVANHDTEHLGQIHDILQTMKH